MNPSDNHLRAERKENGRAQQLGIGVFVLSLILIVTLILSSLSIPKQPPQSTLPGEPAPTLPVEESFEEIPLKVAQVFPAEGSQEIDPSGVITVIFNRPVVPLTTIKQQTTLPNPLQFAPKLEGDAHWLNTSVLVFQPKQPLLSGQTYQVAVRRDFGEGGKALDRDFQWSFTTRPARVEGITLQSGEIDPPRGRGNIKLDEAITIRFLQPMDAETTQAATSLQDDRPEAVPLEFRWNEDNTLLTIKPRRLLRVNTHYQIVVREKARTKSGSSLSEEFQWDFYTLPMPNIVWVMPADKEVQQEYSPLLFIKFSSPMKIDSFKERVRLRPEPEKPLEWWYDEWEYGFYAYGLEPSTRYEVEIQPGIEDIYGNKVLEGKAFTFTTAALPPTVYLRMPPETVFYRSDPKTQYFYLSLTNVKKAVIKLYPLSVKDFSELAVYEKYIWEYSPPQEVIWSREIVNQAELNESFNFKVELSPEGNGLQPGLYFLTLDSPEIPHPYSKYLDMRIVIVANANLTLKTSSSEALAWVTDLESGEPLANVPVQLVGRHQISLGKGVTDQNGVAVVQYDEVYDDSIAIAYTPEGSVVSYASNMWGSGATSVDYALWEGYYSVPGLTRAYIYTERPIYRPGQPVYFKGILRTDDDLEYRQTDLNTVKVRIQSFDKVVWEETLQVSESGTIDGRFNLAEEATLGTYTLSLLNAMDGSVLGEVNFSVAEYRRPEFRVDVSAQPAEPVQGQSGSAIIKAEYYSGGSVADGKLRWTITAQPFIFAPGGEYGDYSFSDEEVDRFEYLSEERGLRVVSEGEGVLDGQGQHQIEFLAKLSDEGNSELWTIEADVTDIAANVVSARQQMIVHQSQLYVGIKPDVYVGEAGREQNFSMVVLDWGANPVANQVVEIEIVERRWQSVQVQQADGSIVWETNVEEIPVLMSKSSTTDENGKAGVSFIPPNGGVFRARACTMDIGERKHCASSYLWVYGGEFIPWRQTGDRSLQVVTDKKEYQAGEVAKILIASPFQGAASALVTVERGHIRSYEVLKLDSNSTVYSLPLSDEMAPNIYVSVAVVKGIDETNPRPAFRVGLAEFKVASQARQLSIIVEKDREWAQPGDEVEYTLRVRDREGTPVKAEISVSLSDLATLSLVEPNSLPIYDFFYNRRALGVRTSLPLLLSMEDYNAFAEEDLIQGAAMGSGGGKGGGALGVVEVRQEFPDTAYWKARFMTNDQGVVRFTVRLPDNLTIWRLDARAVTSDTKVGQVSDDLQVRKPLMVLPKTPRFFVVGDVAEVGATIRNQTGQNLQVKVSLQAEGVEVLDSPDQVVNVQNDAQVYVNWMVRVRDVKRVDLVFAALGGDWQDATKPSMATLDDQGIVVFQYESQEVVATAGSLKNAGSRKELIQIPKRQNQDGELTIRIQPSLGAGLLKGLSYLEYYPYACLEQTVSRFLPNVLLGRAYRLAGLEKAEMQDRLDQLVQAGLQKIYKNQNPDGGWGWWSNEKSDLQTSAYVMLGLVETRNAGYPVNEDVFEQGKQFLKHNLRSVASLKYPYELNQQAFVLDVMARAGIADPSRTVALYEKRTSLAIYAQAYLAEALYLIDSADSRVNTIIADLQNKAIQSATGIHWQEKELDAYSWNTDTRTTAIVLGVLEKIQPNNPTLENVVRWLVQNRLEKDWEGTQETAWTIMALAEWLESSGELQGEYSMSLAVNNRRVGQWEINRENINEPIELRIAIKSLIAAELNQVIFTKGDDSGNAYYTIHLNIPQAVKEIEPLNRGIAVSREYFRPEKPEASIAEAHAGEVIYGRLTLVVPNDVHHLVVEDFLPAGLEAIDQNLVIASQSEPPAKLTWEDLLYKGWGWWWNFDHIELRDERIVLAASYLPAGTYIYTYPLRVVHIGEFQTLPPLAYEFYFPEVFGRGNGMSFRVLP